MTDRPIFNASPLFRACAVLAVIALLAVSSAFPQVISDQPLFFSRSDLGAIERDVPGSAILDSGDDSEPVSTVTVSQQDQSQVSPPPETILPPPEKAERHDAFPNLNIYLPEGEFDIRARKLIRNVLFEGQVIYKFVGGDIATFLRYKYYARNYTYKIGVFDTVAFAALESGSRNFNRVRGGLLLLEYPKNYNNRHFLLLQDDGLSFGDVDNPDNNKNNIYLKLGYQMGTPFDERLNSIAAESRGRIPPVLTAYRDIGPQQFSFAIAVTHALDTVGGDYAYTKLEGEALKRVDFIRTSFIMSRLHLGTIPDKKQIRFDDTLPRSQQYSVPNYELFRIGGRDALKGVNDNERGSDEIHISNELFVPLFRDRDYRTSVLHWNNLFAIGYLGAGSLGFDSKAFTEVSDFAIDAGFGFESSLTVRDYEVFVSLLYARTLDAPAALEGDQIRFSVRTSR